MKVGENFDSVTEHSTGLKPIYAKVEELLRIKQNNKELQRRNIITNYIEPVPRVQLKMKIDRLDQFNKRKWSAIQNSNLNSFRPTQTKTKFSKPDPNGLKIKTKSQKMINFLRSTQTKQNRKKVESPIAIDVNKQQTQRQIFTPMRPLSRISRPPESVSGTEFTKRSGSNRNKSSSGGYSQIVRLSQTSSNTTSPNKYLRKGHRMRQVLLRQLQTPEDIEEEQQLVYLKQYDQWVPASLASYKKLELEHFLNILTGGKKSQKKQLINFQPVYL